MSPPPSVVSCWMGERRAPTGKGTCRRKLRRDGMCGDKGGSPRAQKAEMVDQLPPPLYAVCEYMTCH